MKVFVVLLIEDGSIQRLTSRHSTPTHQAPVMTVNVGGRSRTPSPEPQGPLILLEEDANKQGSHRTCTLPSAERLNNKPPAPPVFFRYVVVTLVCISIQVLIHGHRDSLFCMK